MQGCHDDNDNCCTLSLIDDDNDTTLLDVVMGTLIMMDEWSNDGVNTVS